MWISRLKKSNSSGWSSIKWVLPTTGPSNPLMKSIITGVITRIHKREKLDYDIDGLVIRINDMAAQMSLGDKDLRPLGAMAFKFDNETRECIIRDIIWQVGNSGRLTPVAVVDPVLLVGATVTRASLYNLAYIDELGLDIGAKVLVARANDVIPRIEELVKGTGPCGQAP